MRRGLTGLVVAAVALLAAGCNGTAFDESAEPWNDPDAAWRQPAGTPLTAGITVPDGARLVGPVFTLLDQQKEDIARQSGYLLADGEPYAVSSALANQWDGANSLGEYRRDTLCRQDVDEGVEGKTKNYAYTGDAKPGTVQISCSVGLVLRAPQGDTELAQIETGRTLSFTLTKNITPADAPAQATLGWQPPFVEIPDELPVAPDGVSGPATAAGDSDWVPELDIVDGSFLAGPAWPAAMAATWRSSASPATPTPCSTTTLRSTPARPTSTPTPW